MSNVQQLEYDRYKLESLGAKGILNIKGILKYELSGGTATEIYALKNRGGVHCKPTSLIIDLTNTCQKDLLTNFLPFTYDFIRSMSDKLMPLEIVIVREGKLQLREISMVQPADEWHRLLNIFQQSLNSVIGCSSYTIEVIAKQSIDKLVNCRMGQKALVLLSNSLHMLDGQVMQYLRNAYRSSIKLNLLTFVPYR